MSSLSKKHQKFVTEPMGDKKVTELPGICKVLGPRLEAEGFHKARDVLDQYLDLEQSQELFEKWLKDTCDANKKQSGDCYQCLSDWYKTRGGAEGENTRGSKTNAKKLIPARSESQGRKEEVSRLHGRSKESEKEQEERVFQLGRNVQRSTEKSEVERTRARGLANAQKEVMEKGKKVVVNEIKEREREYRLSREATSEKMEKEEIRRREEEECKTKKDGLVKRTEGSGDERRGKREGEGNWRIAFWNVAGLRNKDEQFWKEIEKWDVIVLIETWLEEENWATIEHELPEGHRWTRQGATRVHRSGRAKGGMMIGVRKDMVGDTREGNTDEEDGLMSRKVKVGRETWTVIGVYVNGDIEEKLISIRRCIEEQGQTGKMIIGGDFNARTGDPGENGEGGRRSKDKQVNPAGRNLIRFLEDVGWEILNGNVNGDEKGEYTFDNERHKTVIDYVLGNETTRRGIEELVIGDKMTSDHHPLVVTMKPSEAETEE